MLTMQRGLPSGAVSARTSTGGNMIRHLERFSGQGVGVGVLSILDDCHGFSSEVDPQRWRLSRLYLQLWLLFYRLQRNFFSRVAADRTAQSLGVVGVNPGINSGT